MEWDNENCIRLIELYQSKPELWQPFHNYYHNKIQKHHAWTDIAKNIGSTVDVIKGKMNSLFASFRRERAKEEKSTGRGKGRDEMYKSRWFAYEAFEFIQNRNKSMKTLNAIKKRSIQEENENAEMDVLEQTTQDDEPTEYTTFDDTTINGSPVNTPYNVHDTHYNINSQATLTEDPVFTPPKFKKRKLKSKQDSRLNQAFDLLLRGSSRDACEVYGEHIAMKLRTYSKRTQAIVQHRFNEILFNADMGQYDMTSSQPNGVTNNATEPLSPYCSEIVSLAGQTDQVSTGLQAVTR